MYSTASWSVSGGGGGRGGEAQGGCGPGWHGTEAPPRAPLFAVPFAPWLNVSYANALVIAYT